MKQNILTGIKCTGTPHIGNYLGMFRPAIDRANSTDVPSFFFIANYHALNQVKCVKELRQSIKEVACTWLACGLDPKKSAFYMQSDVPEVFELATIFTNVTAKGLMNRAHAYKAAVQSNTEAGRDADEDVNMGLYNYPILMAADIILFDTEFVPVGQDQKQHVEIAADIAKSFNAVFGQTLVVPKELIRKEVAIIPGLDGRKMSKSYNNTIPLFCDEAELLKCIKRITTDSSAPDAPKDPNHLIFQLFKHFSSPSLEEVASRSGDGVLDTRIGWGEAKQKLFEAINTAIKPMRERYNYLMANYSEVEKILTDGAVRARKVAQETLVRVRKAIGV